MTASVRAEQRWPSFVLAALIAAGTVFFIGDLIHQLITEGPFGWHLSRARTWQGGLEVLALAAAARGDRRLRANRRAGAPCC